jgi:potassium channel subfamily K
VTIRCFAVSFNILVDAINTLAVVIFGVEHRFSDGYTYGQAFWVTVCSTIVSIITNVSLVVDFMRTPKFSQSGM